MNLNLYLFPLKNYYFGKAKTLKKIEKIITGFPCQANRNSNLLCKKTLVYGLMLVTYHSIPHILLLKGPNENCFELPGGNINIEENEIQGLIRNLNAQLLPLVKELEFDMEIGELLGVFYRPDCRPLILPYLPPHVPSALETIKIYAVQLPEKCVFSTPENQTIVAVPIFDLFNNSFS